MDVSSGLVTLAITPAKVGLAVADMGLDVASGTVGMVQRTLNEVDGQTRPTAVIYLVRIKTALVLTSRLLRLAAEGPLGRSLEPGGPLERMLDDDGLLDRLLTEEGLADRLTRADGLLDKLTIPNGPLDQLELVADTLNTMAPALEALGPTTEMLRDAVDTLTSLIDPLNIITDRIPLIPKRRRPKPSTTRAATAKGTGNKG